MQHTVSGQTAFATLGAVTDGAKGGFNGMVVLKLCSAVPESHRMPAKLFSVFLQTARGFGILGLIGVDKQVEGFICMVPGIRPPDVVQCLVWLWAAPDLGRALSTLPVLCIQQRC